MAEVSGREPMEYLRVFVRIRLKVDFIRGMFVPPCIPVFGLMQFYPDEVGAGFALQICGAMTVFTRVNGTSLRMRYRAAGVMLREFRRMNRAFPPLGTEIGVIALERKPGLVLRRHGLTLAAFLWLMGERVGTKFCIVPDETGWMCLPGAVV